MRRLLSAVFALGALASVAQAQATGPRRPTAADRAAATITEQDVRRRVSILADDSMRGRNTPSPELEEVAAYIAGEFRRFGLRPGGDSGSFLQRYALDRVQFVPESSVAFIHGAPGGDVTLAAKTDFIPAQAVFDPGDYAGDVVVLAGAFSGPTQADTAALAGKFFVLAGPIRSQAEVNRLRAWRPAAVVTLSAATDSIWARVAEQSTRVRLKSPVSQGGGPNIFAVTVREQTLRPILARAGADLDTLRQRAGTNLGVTMLPGVALHVHAQRRVVEQASAPNVIGILEGSDAQLKSEYVFFSAHMDHVGHAADRTGCQARGGDSICNGADDDGSGTTAVVELAEAFSQLRPRPRRSLVFMTVSGEEKGLWGSGYYSEHPTLPLANTVADLNIDMIGRNWKDTVSVIGRQHSDLGTTLDRLAAAHPELGMRPVDDLWPQENFYFRSDHYNFARKGVPILFFFTGTHPDYHQVTDSPDKIDAEKEARIARLIFYLGLEVANATQRPQWNADSYKQIVEGSGR